VGKIAVPSLATYIVLVWLVCAGCSGEPSKSARSTEEESVPTPAVAQPTSAPPGGEEVHRRLIEAINAGDVDGTMALFHEDSNVWEALGCRPNCQGLPKIREAIQAVTANHWRFDNVSIETLKTTYTTWTSSKAELRGDDIAAAGLERVRAGFAVATRDGKIASLRGGYDQADDETRRFVAQAPRPGPINPSPTMTAYGRLVDVGGRRIYMECIGDGDPTVIFEGGSSAVRGAASSGIWAGGHGLVPTSVIQPEVGKVTRACTYDPASVGLSDPRPRPSTGRQDAEDMHRLLHAAGFAPPYVIVGISYGGQVMQLFASMYPAETAGVVLLDASPGWDFYERWAAALPPEPAERFWASVRQGWAQSKTPQGLAGGTDQEATLTELRMMGPWPDVPLTVLTAGIPYHPWNVAAGADVQQREQIRYDVQAALARLAPRGTHRIVDTSEHSMNAFVPNLIVDVIRRTVEAARKP
jgi:pimeloyl-ACP methyl ester carboxylesterase/ketosteroid isomerase-like protein